jgi:glycosyltransferase involved in cell wall biosynthesis
MTVLHPGVNGPIPKLVPPMVQGLTELGVEVIQIPYSRRLGTQAREEPLLTKIFDRTDDLKALAVKARQTRPDILLANTTQDPNSLLRDIPMAFVARLFGIPIVLLYHGSRAQFLSSNRSLRAMTGVLLSLTNGLLLLSSQDVPLFRHYWPRHRYANVRLPFSASGLPSGKPFPNGYPRSWPASRRPLLLFVGRLVSDKGIQDLVEALPIVLTRVMCRLAILGEGELAPSLQKRIRTLGLEDVVHFAGYVRDQDELQSWYNAATCLVLPTYLEGFSVVVLEAMANSLPIICTRVGGMVDHLHDGIHALYVPPRNPPALAARVIELLENPALQKQMSRANRELIQQFQPVEVMREYVEFFRQVRTRENSAT